ncbi:VPS4-associated protein 1 [Rhizophagus diaphanus]|nr:VPS4-associated protein 1 [Rhizophagus diaphanus] [Rhizophagus sp. MUCL 43196]
MSNKTEQLINLYTHRIATTDKPCFICNKYTSSVLRTDNGLDWFYTCESHLSDRGFATPIPEPEPEPKLPVVQSTRVSISQKDDSSKSKSDPDINQEKDKSNDSTKVESKQQEGSEDNVKEQTEDKQQVATPKSPEKPQPPKSTKPKQYKLHSNIFYLREDKLNKKRQKEEAQKILSKLPNVPKNSLQ